MESDNKNKNYFQNFKDFGGKKKGIVLTHRWGLQNISM